MEIKKTVNYLIRTSIAVKGSEKPTAQFEALDFLLFALKPYHLYQFSYD